MEPQTRQISQGQNYLLHGITAESQDVIMTNSDASFSTVPETPEDIFNLDCSDMLVPESQSIDEIDQFSEEHGNHSNMHK